MEIDGTLPVQKFAYFEFAGSLRKDVKTGHYAQLGLDMVSKEKSHISFIR